MVASLGLAPWLHASTNGVVTLPVTDLTMTSATLHGTVDPQGLPTVAWFSYNSLSGPVYMHLPPENGPVAVDLPVTDLVPGGNYGCGLIATNANGLRFGNGVSFKPPWWFTTSTSALPATVMGGMAIADFNDDGWLDLVMVGEDWTRFYTNQGSFSFALFQEFGFGFNPAICRWLDVDADQRLDLVLAGGPHGNPTTTVLRQQEDGTFANANLPLHGLTYGSIQHADFNRDGRLDIFISGQSNESPFTIIYENVGPGVYAPMPQNLPSYLETAAAVADYDADGLTDVLISGRWGAGALEMETRLLRNTGGGVFVDVATNLPPTRSGWHEWADFDMDGRLDMLISGATLNLYTTRIVRNVNDQLFLDGSGNLLRESGHAQLVADMNYDGRPDFFKRGQDGSSSSVPPESYSAIVINRDDTTWDWDRFALPETWKTSGGWGDFDNDGILDLIVSGDTRTGPMVFVHKGNAVHTNHPPTVPAGLSDSVVNRDVRLSWAPSHDPDCGWGGVTYDVRIGSAPGLQDVRPTCSLGNGYRRVLQPGLAGTTTNLVLENLVPGRYFWAVQAVDNSHSGSAFSAEGSFEVHPLHFIAVQPSPNQGLMLQCQGLPHMEYLLQGSQDMAVWADMGVFLADVSGRFDVLISTHQETTPRARFFRLTIATAPY